MPTSGWSIGSWPVPATASGGRGHWLDLVRYAETAGHEFDYDIPNAYRYRDYVIRALNADMPYDRFVVEHLAGDLLECPRRHPVERFNESIIATGFYYLGEGTHSPVDVREEEVRRIDNQIDVISKAFLGLTVACARCHDHKFDPIATRDYYALAGFLRSSRYQQAFIDPPDRIGDPVAPSGAAREAIRRRSWPHAASAPGTVAERPGSPAAARTRRGRLRGLRSRRLRRLARDRRRLRRVGPRARATSGSILGRGRPARNGSSPAWPTAA